MIVYLDFPQAENIEFVEVNVNNYNATIPVFGTYNLDYFFHYAAVVVFKLTIENFIKSIQISQLGKTFKTVIYTSN
jgi:hypothetical protein